MAARGIDLARLYEAEAAKERNEAAEKRRLSQARAKLDKKLNEEDSCRTRN